MPLNGEYTIMKRIRKEVIPEEGGAPEGEKTEQGVPEGISEGEELEEEKPKDEVPEDEFEVITDTIKIADGYGTFTLKGGETIKIQDLPHGAEYYVTEEDAEYFEKVIDSLIKPCQNQAA